MTNEMTAEEAVKILTYERDNDIFVTTEHRAKIHQALTMAIHALEVLSTDADCISREEAIACCRNEWEEEVEERLRTLPSVTPQYTDEEIDKAQAVEQAYVDKMVELAIEETKRPKGKWIDVNVCCLGL